MSIAQNQYDIALSDPASYSVSESDLDWAVNEAFLYLGRAGYQDGVWPLYFAAATARGEGERDYRAEEELFRLMTAAQIMTR